MMAVMCALTYMRLNQVDASNFFILLPEKEDVKCIISSDIEHAKRKQ